MHSIDYILIGLYLAGLMALGLVRRLKKDASPSELIVGGRMLTLPAFVASLVSTWYGGILGVGEFSFRYGLSNWLVFGLPYYLAAFLFAVLLAKKARESEVLTIPDRLAQAYGKKTAVVGSVIIYVMTVPAAYILMLGVLCQYLFGWPFWIGVTGGTAFSIIYVFLGGFRSVVRTDLLQFALMFLGFVVLLVVVYLKYGGAGFIAESVPSDHLTWHGGNTGLYIGTWYVIALATLVEPAFYQRCYAARNASVARNGILISIGCWAFFDFLTTTCGLYARAILPDLADPVSSYPALALEVLPAGLLGLFALTLLSTVMSTVDSYSFVAASTFGKDIIQRLCGVSDRAMNLWTKIGLFVSAGLAVVVAIYFRSVVDIWHAFGSIGTPALLGPVLVAFACKRRFPASYALTSILLSGGLSLTWYLSRTLGETGDYWFGIEPIFPGVICSGIVYLIFLPRSRLGLR